MDSSSHGGIDGAYMGEPTLGATGQFDTAVSLTFDPQNQTWQKISIPDAVSVKPGSGDFTLEAYVKPDSAGMPGRMTILAKRANDGTLGYALSLCGGYPALRLRYVYSLDSQLVYNELSVAGNVRVATDVDHLAAVREGSNVRLYVNGFPCGGDILPDGAEVVDTDGSLQLGADAGTSVVAAEPYSGLLDEVRLSSVARYTGFTTPEATGSGLDGAVLGGAQIDSEGRWGPCLALNGTTQKVEVADDASLDFDSGSSLEAWVNPSAVDGVRGIFSKWTQNSKSYRLSITDGHLVFEFSHDGSTIAQTITGASTIATGEWTRVAVMRNETAVTLYVNNVADGTASYNGTFYNGSMCLVLGEGFVGKLDDMRFGMEGADPSTVEETEYTYNARNQLVTENTNDSMIIKEYSYDCIGNILMYTEDNYYIPSSTFTALAFDEFDRMTWYVPEYSNASYTYLGVGPVRARRGPPWTALQRQAPRPVPLGRDAGDCGIRIERRELRVCTWLHLRHLHRRTLGHVPAGRERLAAVLPRQRRVQCRRADRFHRRGCRALQVRGVRQGDGVRWQRDRIERNGGRQPVDVHRQKGWTARAG